MLTLSIRLDLRSKDGVIMKYAIMVLALVGVLASPRPAAVEDDNDLLDACKSGLACVTYMTGWADGSRSWYP